MICAIEGFNQYHRKGSCERHIPCFTESPTIAICAPTHKLVHPASVLVFQFRARSEEGRDLLKEDENQSYSNHANFITYTAAYHGLLDSLCDEWHGTLSRKRIREHQE